VELQKKKWTAKNFKGAGGRPSQDTVPNLFGRNEEAKRNVGYMAVSTRAGILTESFLYTIVDGDLFKCIMKLEKLCPNEAACTRTAFG
jgi:hypothetical protein